MERGKQTNSRASDSTFRELVRRDLTQWWARNHPSAPQLTTSRQVIWAFIAEEIHSVRKLSAHRVTLLNAKADRESRKAKSIIGFTSEPPPETIEAVYSAYLTVHARSSWETALDDFLEDHPAAFIPVFLVILIAFGLAWSLSVHSEDFHGFTVGNYFELQFVVTCILFAYRLTAKVLGRAARWAADAWRTLFLCLVAALLVKQGWRRDIKAWSHSSWAARERIGGFHIIGDPLEVCVLYAIKIAFVLALTSVVITILQFAIVRSGPKSPPDQLACAQMVLKFLEVVVLSRTALVPQDSDEDPSFRSYFASAERRQLVRALESIARFAEGKWKRTVTTGDRAADISIAQLADGIAAAARRWKIVAATSGRAELFRMHQSFVAALNDCAKGDWKSLGVEVSARELLARRLLKWARHILALSIMTATALILAHKPPFGFPVINSPISGWLLVMVSSMVSAAVDPTIGQRVGAAIKLGSEFTQKGN